MPKKKFDSSWDIFISHAEEDKELIALPLYDHLVKKGLNVWIDKKEFQIGNYIKDMIDEGLEHCNYGVIIVSQSYLKKRWTLYEYEKLYRRQIEEKRAIIIPVWHNIVSSDLEFSSLHFLKDVFALHSSIGTKSLSKEIFNILMKSRFT